MAEGSYNRVSPLSSPSSTSSFEYLSAHSQVVHSDSFDMSGDVSLDSDDEIVWSVSDISVSAVPNPRAHLQALALSRQLLRSPDQFSDDDFIVLSRPRSPLVFPPALTSNVAGLANILSNLSLTSPPVNNTLSPRKNRVRSKRKSSARSSQSLSSSSVSASRLPPSPCTPKPRNAQPAAGSGPIRSSPKKKSRSKRKTKVRTPPNAAVNAGLGDRPIVDDISEAGDNTPSIYEEAVKYINSFLSDPSPKPNSLTLLQALIIELGLFTSSEPSDRSTTTFYTLSSLPHSLKAAKATLKANVFLNVRDYLAVREQGLAALRAVMHPSRKALVKDINRKGVRRMPRDAVKRAGLGVFLVTCYR